MWRATVSRHAVITPLLFYCPQLDVTNACNETNLMHYVSSDLYIKLTLSLLMSHIYGAPCKSRNFNVVYIYVQGVRKRLYLFYFFLGAQCVESGVSTRKWQYIEMHCQHNISRCTVNTTYIEMHCQHNIYRDALPTQHISRCTVNTTYIEMHCQHNIKSGYDQVSWLGR
jgi:hypothetical protein